jgi:hypothetical protein
VSCLKYFRHLYEVYTKSIAELWQNYMVLCGRYMSLWPLWPLWTTVDIYGIYVALPQGPVDGPGIADGREYHTLL